jgi:hypothetical protein
LKESIFEKIKVDYNGLVRANLEKLLFEEKLILKTEDSHKLMLNILMNKLLFKIGSPDVVNKAIEKESKIIYKYKDIEEIIFKKIAAE